jgi:hypothetical protein
MERVMQETPRKGSNTRERILDVAEAAVLDKGFDTELVDSLKALDPERPIREADICGCFCLLSSPSGANAEKKQQYRSTPGSPQPLTTFPWRRDSFVDVPSASAVIVSTTLAKWVWGL